MTTAERISRETKPGTRERERAMMIHGNTLKLALDVGKFDHKNWDNLRVLYRGRK